MRKKMCIYILLLLLSVTFVVPGSAKAAVDNAEETVYDYADLLSQEEEKRLREYSENYEKHDISVIFLTTEDAQGKSSMTYSDDFYDTHSFMADGVLFMIDMDNREIYINTVGKCISWLDDEIYDILDDTYQYASEGAYFTCLSKMSEKACKEIENYTNPLLGAVRPSLLIVGITMVITVLILVILLVKHNKANRKIATEHYLGNTFTVNNKNVVYIGCRPEVIHGYYAQKSSSGGSGSHRSSGGVSHGGGGRRF